jgi:pimeloyl-ACP methyl ester carboxylesterase
VVGALPDEPVDAVGFSLGAMTLLELAAREPHRFGRLVVGGVGESVFREDPDRYRAILAAVDGEPGGDDDNVGRLFAQYATQPGNDRAALAACLRRRSERLTADRLAAVKLPVLVAIGDRDFAGPGEPLVEALPDARLVVLKNTDHFATPESFAFIDAALEFLDALSA